MILGWTLSARPQAGRFFSNTAISCPKTEKPTILPISSSVAICGIGNRLFLPCVLFSGYLKSTNFGNFVVFIDARSITPLVRSFLRNQRKFSLRIFFHCGCTNNINGVRKKKNPKIQIGNLLCKKKKTQKTQHEQECRNIRKN